MFKIFFKKTFLLAAGILFYTPSWAALSPLSVSIVPPLQFPGSSFDITGARVSLISGSHRSVWGLDVGVIGNITNVSFTGIAVSGVYNYTDGSVFALAQIAGLTNINHQKTNIVGLQFALAANYNSAASSVVGLQFALANLTTHTDIYGFQIGLYNSANEVYGFQIGLINKAKNLHGLQIGLLNIHQMGLFYVAPILNIGF